MYCRRCGTKMNPDGVCPECGAFDPDAVREPLPEDRPRPKGKKKKKRKKKKHIFGKLLLVFLVIYVVCFIFGNGYKVLYVLGTMSRTIPVQSTAQEAAAPIPTPTPAYPMTTVRPTATPRPTSTPAPTKSPAKSGIRPEFQSAMDQYISFFEDYAAFMKKFSANPSNAGGLMMDYLNFLTKYTQVMDTLNSMDTSQLSPEENKLYTQTMLKIDKILIDAIPTN